MIIGYIFAILSAIIYGCMPIMAKYIYADGVNALTLVFLRNFLALPVLAILAFSNKKCKHTKRSIFMSIVPALFGCALTPILLFSSYNYLDSGVSTVFHFTYPALVLLISVIFLRNKPKPITLIGVALCFAGILLFFDPTKTPSAIGTILALGSGVTFAIYITMLPSVQKPDFNGFTFCFYIALWSSIITFIICLISGKLALPSTLVGWGLCALFSLLVTVGAVFLFQQGTMIIGGVNTSILSTLEPITSVVIGIIFLSEPLKIGSIIGVVLVITSSILIAVADFKKKESKTKTNNYSDK